MVARTVGVCRSGLPAITRWRSSTWWRSTASSWKAGSVDQHVAVLDALADQLPEALQIDAQLLQAGLRRHVERLQRRLVDAARDAQAVVVLEAAHAASRSSL